MSLENPPSPVQGITLYSHADDFRSHWIRFLLAEKQIKYHLILTDHEDEDLADLNPYIRQRNVFDQKKANSRNCQKIANFGSRWKAQI